MSVEQLSYIDLAERLKITTEAAHALAKRLHLPRTSTGLLICLDEVESYARGVESELATQR